jgi:TonB family protein
MRPVLRAACAAVRLWTALYTWRLPPDVRDARRTEIAADLWDHAHDRDCREPPSAVAFHMMARLVLGVRDDVEWRGEQLKAQRRHSMRTAVTAGLAVVVPAAGLVLAAAILLNHAPPAPLPGPPQAVRQSALRYPVPPPPPPPVGDSAHDRPLAYGRTSYEVAGDGPAPARITEVRPVYPPILHDNDVEGVVVVEAAITEEGRVADARAVRRAGLLTQPAIDAVRRWEFAPAAHGRTLTVTVSFTTR